MQGSIHVLRMLLKVTFDTLGQWISRTSANITNLDLQVKIPFEIKSTANRRVKPNKLSWKSEE